MAVKSDPSLESQIRACNQEALNQLRSYRLDDALVQLQRAGKLLHALQPPTKTTRNTLKADLVEPKRSHSSRNERLDVKMHLKECMLKSKLGDHVAALRHAQEAVRCADSGESRRNKGVYRALAHYSEAMEWENLKEKQGAKVAYSRAVEAARKDLGGKHEITKKLLECWKEINGNTGKTQNTERLERLERTMSPGTFKEFSLQAVSHTNFKLKSPHFTGKKSLKNTLKPLHSRSVPRGKSTLLHSQSPLSPSQTYIKSANLTAGFSPNIRKSLKLPISEDLLSAVYRVETPTRRVSTEGKTVRSPIQIDMETKAKGVISELERLKKIVSDENRLHVPSFRTSRLLAPKIEKKYRFTANPHQLSPIPEMSSRTKISPVVKIQAAVRCFVAKKKYQKQRKAVLVLQKRVRGYQIVTLFRNIRAAIVCIQRWWRRCKLKQQRLCHQ